MNPEKLKKLQAQAELVRIGGKGVESKWNISYYRWELQKTEINIFKSWIKKLVLRHEMN